MVSPTLEVLMAKSNAKTGSRSKSAKIPKRKTKRDTGAASAVSSGKTKHDQILKMLRTRGGAKIAAIARVTGWQPHSVRGFLASVVKKKLGLSIASEKTSSGRVYRIVEMKPSVSSRKAAPEVEQPNA
jgi:uncharacterized protein DUF3489